MKTIAPVIAAVLLTSANLAYANPADYYDKALAAFNTERVDEAYILLKNALRDNPNHLPSKLLMGRILLIDGHLIDAIDELEETLQLGADKNLVIVPLSRAYLFTGQYQKIFSLQQEKDLNSDVRLDLLLIGGEANVRLGKNELAVQQYEKGLQLYPDSPRMLNSLASLYVRESRFNQARELLNRSLRIESNSALTLHELGKLENAEGNAQKALNYFQQADKLNPQQPDIMRSMAALYAETGEFDTARALVTEIELQSPGDMQNRLLKARILALTNQQFEADKILRELTQELSLLTDEQRNERIQLSLIAGIVAYINQNFDLASTELSRYVSEREPSAEIIGMLADALLKVGYYKDAIDALEKHQSVITDNLDVAVLTCELYIAVKRSFKCERLLPEIESKYPGDARVSLLQARLLLAKNLPQQALQLLDEQVPDSQRLDVLQLKTMLLASQGQLERALDLAKEITLQAPDNLDFKALYADIAIRLDDMNLASKLVNDVLRREPENVAANIAKARVAFAQDKRTLALEILETLIKSDKRNISALLLAGQIYTLEAQYELAIDRLLIAKALNTSDRRPRELLVSVYRQQRDYRNALSETNQLLNMNRLSEEYMMQKAEILLAMDERKDAASQLNVLYAQWSDSPGKLISLSKLQTQAFDYEGAERSLNTAVKLLPNSALPKLELASYLLGRNRIDDAKKLLSDFEKQFGDTANTQLLKGDYANAKEQPQTAFAHYLASSRKDSSFRLPLIRLYSLASSGVRRDDFIQHLRNNEAFKDDNFAQHLLADTFFIDGQHDKAESIYQALLEKPDVARKAYILNNLANIYAAKDLLKAINYSEQALALEATSPALLDTKGWLLALDGKLDEALDILRQSYTLNADDPTVHYHLAYVLDKLGRPQDALKELEQHDTLAKEFPEKDAARALLEKLK